MKHLKILTAILALPVTVLICIGLGLMLLLAAILRGPFAVTHQMIIERAWPWETYKEFAAIFE